ncbi:hypothetical protein CRM22_000384 [Opisthorchis felineus]|uniref:Uncharacterized protein n=1 Tax=Opisthorchis felineus TaxID=147828 RepID=A0A4S2MFM2_OPIFE|nr:hypothetical protein CRM22_000384 [Opisthorchis felineus]
MSATVDKLSVSLSTTHVAIEKIAPQISISSVSFVTPCIRRRMRLTGQVLVGRKKHKHGQFLLRTCQCCSQKVWRLVCIWMEESLLDLEFGRMTLTLRKVPAAFSKALCQTFRRKDQISGIFLTNEFAHICYRFGIVHKDNHAPFRNGRTIA